MLYRFRTNPFGGIVRLGIKVLARQDLAIETVWTGDIVLGRKDGWVLEATGDPTVADNRVKTGSAPTAIPTF